MSGNNNIFSCCYYYYYSCYLGSKTRSSSDRRVLDDGTRMRRHKRQLEALEKDNHHDDPHASFAHLLNKVKLPSFSDGTESKSRDTL